jgi:hypothetical protein
MSMIQRVLELEISIVPGMLILAVLLQFLAGRIRLRGLLASNDDSRRISWARAQLLIAALLTAGYLAFAIWTPTTGRFPALSPFWIYLMIASCAVYLVHEARGRARRTSGKEAL